MALARSALARGWVVADGDAWRVSEDVTERVARDTGLDIALDPTSRRSAVRACRDWTEHLPHLAGGLGAALLTAMIDAGWLARTTASRALRVTSEGEERLRRTGIHGVVVDESGCDADNLCTSGGITVTAAAAEDWGALVERATREGWTGITLLAAFDGTIADAVRHNVRAFGQQAGDAVWSVRTWDRSADTQRTFAMVDCQFRPGGSVFATPEGCRRYDILEVTLLLRSGTITAPLRDPELARLLGVPEGTRVPLPVAREAVLAGVS